MADKERGPGTASAEISKYLEILARDQRSRVFAPLAEAYRKAGLLDDAIATALEGLRVHPTYLGGRVALGRAYFEKRQFVEAAAEMQKVAAAAPDNIVAHKVLGQIAYGQSDLASAERAFKMVLLLDPRDPEALQFMANIGGGSRPAPVTAPAPAAPAAPAPPPMPAPPPLMELEPFEELAPLDGSDLPSLTLEELPPPAVRTHAQIPPDDLAIEDLVIDVPMPNVDVPEPEPSAPPAVAPVPAPRATTPAALELEVFSRVPWGGESAQMPAAPPAAPIAEPAPTAPVAAPSVHDEPVFEVFGRPKRGGPPVSSKGERQIYAEIELEPTAHAPTEDPSTDADGSPFEIFTREPRVPATGARSRPLRTEGGGYHDIELETTAYLPGTAPPEAAPPLAEQEFDHAFNLEEELPPIDLAREVEPEPSDEEPEPASAATPDPAAGRGVFDTETLATIYINQGFHGRAAEIYQRLLDARPDDAGLRQKLEDLQALERLERQPAAPAPAVFASPPALAAPAAAAAAPAVGPDGQIHRLQTLLEAFRGGRPQ